MGKRRSVYRVLGRDLREREHLGDLGVDGRLRLVFGTELSAKNKIQTVGSLAVPVLRYSFGIVNWRQEELHKLDRKTRKLFNIHGQHHTKADIDHLSFSTPKKDEGT
jgi:hypothetical protein